MQLPSKNAYPFARHLFDLDAPDFIVILTWESLEMMALVGQRLMPP